MSESWTFFTNHAHVLFSISQNPDVRIRDVAALVGITERAAQRIIAELEEAGYLQHEKIGRRNRYHLTTNHSLRHPIEAHVTVDDLLGLLGEHSRSR